jgi:hypothetical protein
MKAGQFVLVVMAVAVLSGCDVPWGPRKKAHTALAVQLEMRQIEYAISYYKLSVGEWPWGTNISLNGKLEPKSLFGVISAFDSTNDFMVKNSRWSEAQSFVDPWGQDYRIRVLWDSSGLNTYSNATIRVWSCGKNLRDDNGAKDDMVLQP